MIEQFQDEFRFLSNFIGGVEQKYQAAKAAKEEDRDRILKMTPGEAKRATRQVEIRPDWDSVKVQVMEELVREKFSKEPFKSLILKTGDEFIQEGNLWKDTFWGVDLRTGKGQNHLGRILMRVRDTLKTKDVKQQS